MGVLLTYAPAVYDLIYSWKDYPAEVARLRGRVGRVGGTLLDVACGTGRHLELLAPHYRAEGVDLDRRMVEAARARGLVVHQADLLDFDLGRRFDVVTCLFSSIGYIRDLDAAIANLARHLSPDVILAVEPWLTPDVVEPGHIALHTAQSDSLRVARMSTVEVDGQLSVVVFHYLVGRDGAIEHHVERHEMWLRTPDEYAAAFRGAGLEPTYDPEGLMGRGLWLGVVSGPDRWPATATVP